MHHAVYGRKLSRTKNERRRLLQGLVRDLIIHGTIKTTDAKAKAVRPLVERLITQAKGGTRADLSQIEKTIASKDIEKMLISDVKTRFAKRTSGFTRIIKLGARLGDSTEEVLFQLVDERIVTEVVQPKAKKVEVAKVEEKVAKKPTKKTVKK